MFLCGHIRLTHLNMTTTKIYKLTVLDVAYSFNLLRHKHLSNKTLLTLTSNCGCGILKERYWNNKLICRSFSNNSNSIGISHTNTRSSSSSSSSSKSIIISKTFLKNTDQDISSFRFKNKFTKRVNAMSTVHIKSYPDDDRLSISIELLQGLNIKSFNLNRLKTESLESSIQRLQMNLAKKLTKKKKKTKKAKDTDNKADAIDESAQEISVHIIHNGNIVDMSMTNENAWIEGAYLKIDNEEIPMYFNPPSVKLESLCPVILEGYPLYPHPCFEFVEEKDCEFYWKTISLSYLDKVKQVNSKGNIDLSGTITGNSYTPNSDDLGKYIFLACIPKKGDKNGRPDVIISKSPVTSGPGCCPFEKRHKFTQLFTEHGVFRIMSYNLLAEMYADSDAARTELFVHCASHALDMNYRKNLLIKEILGYQADLLCMQEVDRSIFEHHLQPILKMNGYTGFFRPKAGQVGEGCATFIRDTKFTVVKQMDIKLSEYLSSHPDVSDIWSEVTKSEILKMRVEERSSILQVTIVESTENPGRYICLGNTHLYFHPTADNVRLIHGATALRYLQSACQAFQNEGKDTALVFCGDFNSDPKVGIYQLYTSQFVPADCVDWESAGPEEKISLELRQSMNIESACGTPAYTNFTPLFQETLDYIFIESDKICVESMVPLPDHEEVTADSGLPSPVFPSDHIALICDLKFKL